MNLLHLCDIGHEIVWCGSGVFADLAAWVSSYRVEVAQGDDTPLSSSTVQCVSIYVIRERLIVKKKSKAKQKITACGLTLY
jgi:hypothetical protein